MTNFQRGGSISNSHVGRAFELRAQQVLAEHGLVLVLNHKVPLWARQKDKGPCLRPRIG